LVVQRMDEPSTGAGEEVMGATARRSANGVFDATGCPAAGVSDDAAARAGALGAKM